MIYFALTIAILILTITIICLIFKNRNYKKIEQLKRRRDKIQSDLNGELNNIDKETKKIEETIDNMSNDELFDDLKRRRNSRSNRNKA
jgi:hypothetical protein